MFRLNNLFLAAFMFSGHVSLGDQSSDVRLQIMTEFNNLAKMEDPYELGILLNESECGQTQLKLEENYYITIEIGDTASIARGPLDPFLPVDVWYVSVWRTKSTIAPANYMYVERSNRFPLKTIYNQTFFDDLLNQISSKNLEERFKSFKRIDMTISLPKNKSGMLAISEDWLDVTCETIESMAPGLVAKPKDGKVECRPFILFKNGNPIVVGRTKCQHVIINE